jgi:hypothetical protein
MRLLGRETFKNIQTLGHTVFIANYIYSKIIGFQKFRSFSPKEELAKIFFPYHAFKEVTVGILARLIMNEI